MIVYELNPIDHWAGWQKPEAVVQHSFDDPPDDYFDGLTLGEFNLFLERAKALALHLGWEGDMRSGPYLAGFPDPDGGWISYIVAWKQDNNGTTFVASRHRLPHLESDYHKNWITDE